MSDPQQHHDDGPHEGPIKTPKQLVWAVVFSFLAPIFAIVLLVNYVTTEQKPAAGTDTLSNEQAIAQRIKPVGVVEIKDASDVTTLKTGEQVYQAQCVACHAAGAAGAPKLGDVAAWGPRIKTGYEALLTSSLKGKGSMGAQGGGDFSDVEIGRAVVYMANQGGAKFDEPKPTTAAAAPAAPVAAAAAMPDAKVEAKADAVPALYAQVCAACHIAGVAGAPKLGDKAAWQTRLALGVDELTASVIKGKGAMPPRGGSAGTDADIKTAVSYMVASVK